MQRGTKVTFCIQIILVSTMLLMQVLLKLLTVDVLSSRSTELSICMAAFLNISQLVVSKQLEAVHQIQWATVQFIKWDGLLEDLSVSEL